jgi:hypothetical protein
VQCPAPCFAIFKRDAGACPKCGRPVDGGGRRELETVDGELEAVDVATLRKERKREQGAARSLEDLVRLGVRRGLKKPSEWAAITNSARAGRKPTGEDFQKARAIMHAIQNPVESRGEEAF